MQYVNKTIRRLLAAFGAGLVALTALAAGPASADWRRAESERFIVYSENSEGVLRAYVQKLERFDLFMRQRLGLSLDEPPLNKMTIVLVDNRRELQVISPRISDGIVGVYYPVTEGIFAVAIRDGDDDTLLHEYTHHFMFQHSRASYPAWLTEGFAEYFMTADIDNDSITIGGYNINRAIWLQDASWLSIDDLLSKRQGELRRPTDQATYYPVAWLLTHWFMGNTERRVQLQAYIDDVNAGGDPVEAMQRATGLTIPQLRNALRTYMNGRIPRTRYTFDLQPAYVSITTLPPAEADLLLLGQRLKIGVREGMREATAEEVRRRAARHGDAPFARLQLGHAELHFGDAAEGERILADLIEHDPENVEALQLLAGRYIDLSAEEGQDRSARLGQARAVLARAYALDDADYRTFILLGEMRQGASNYPTENDVTTWSLAHALAPQLAQTTLGYASALMLTGRNDEAATLLGPLANAPHGGPASEAAATLIERARADQAPLSQDEIEAAAEAEAEDAEDEPAPAEPGEEAPSAPPAS